MSVKLLVEADGAVYVWSVTHRRWISARIRSAFRESLRQAMPAWRISKVSRTEPV